MLSPAIAGAGRVYIADLTGHVAALEIPATSHREVWSLALGGGDYASPTVGPNGSIYTASGTYRSWVPFARADPARGASRSASGSRALRGASIERLIVLLLGGS